MASEKFDFIVISRRSRFRAGLRYERRGIDVDGNVANMVETEQVNGIFFFFFPCEQDA